MTVTEYDPADDARKCYDLALEIKRERGDTHWPAKPWQRRVVIGDCTLYLGDCLEVMPVLRADSVRLLFTDPPYGHNNADGDLLSVMQKGAFKGIKKAINGAKPIANDGMEDMRRVVDGMLRLAVPLFRHDSCCCCCCCRGGPRPTFAWLAERMDREGLAFFHSTIWNKVNPGLGWRYKRQHEMIMVAHRRNGSLAWSDAARPIGNVFDGFHPGNIRQHPNEKPLWLVQGFVERHTERDDLVLDPFMGGGTTGVACAATGRRFIGIELDEGHFETACRRIREAYAQPDMLIEQPRPAAPVQEAMSL